MVDLAQEMIRVHMGPDIDADAIVETKHCLPDAIQIFTPCTIGNGWLKILDWGKFALSLYDKKKLTGYRVWFDVSKASQFPNLYNWYQRLVAKKDLPLDVLLGTILDAGDSVLSSSQITMTHHFRREKKAKTRVCPRCGEAFGAHQGLICAACSGESYYDINSTCTHSVACR